jgi:transcriptional regulator with XRE-family HTH domain
MSDRSFFWDEWPVDGYGERIRRAWRLYEAHHGDVTVTDLVGLLAGSGCAVSRAQVSRWTNGKQEPTIAEFVALGRVFQVRPEWLAFASEPMAAEAVVPDAAAPPVDPPALDPRVTIAPAPSIHLTAIREAARAAEAKKTRKRRA